MPNYWCKSCQKLLAPNECRYNIETVTTPGNLVIGQLPIGGPLIGRRFDTTRTHEVVRCKECGSDVEERLTEEEQKYSDELRQKWAKEATRKSKRARWVGIIIIAIAIYIILGALVRFK